MSRSKKKAIYKDKGINHYLKMVRGSINSAVRDIFYLIDKDDYLIPHPKETICDYEYSDYKIDCEYKHIDSEWKRKLSRK